MTIRILTIPCADDALAEDFAEYLRAKEELDVSGVEGREVRIPWGGDPLFAFGVAEIANERGYAHDDEAAKAVREALTEAGFR